MVLLGLKADLIFHFPGQRANKTDVIIFFHPVTNLFQDQQTSFEFFFCPLLDPTPLSSDMNQTCFPEACEATKTYCALPNAAIQHEDPTWTWSVLFTLFFAIPPCFAGFTYLELRTAGIKNHRYAQSIGLAVDKRRRNHSEEGLALNVERIKAYMSKLVVLPMNPVKKLRKVCKRSVEKKVESAKKPADSKKTKKASEKLKSWNEKKKGIIEKAKEERKKAKTEKPTEKPKEVRTQVKDVCVVILWLLTTV